MLPIFSTAATCALLFPRFSSGQVRNHGNTNGIIYLSPREAIAVCRSALTLNLTHIPNVFPATFVSRGIVANGIPEARVLPRQFLPNWARYLALFLYSALALPTRLSSATVTAVTKPVSLTIWLLSSSSLSFNASHSFSSREMIRS